jgi:hypothetical protein
MATKAGKPLARITALYQKISLGQISRLIRNTRAQRIYKQIFGARSSQS